VSLKKLKNIFIESDKFGQIDNQKMKSSTIEGSVPTSLSDMQDPKLDEKFASERVKNPLNPVDVFQNQKAEGFEKNMDVGQTKFKIDILNPLSQQGLGGTLGPALAKNILLTDDTVFQTKLKTLADTRLEQNIIDKSSVSIMGTSLKNEEIAFDKNLKEGGIDGTTSPYEAALGSLAGPYQGGGILSSKGIGGGLEPGYVTGILNVPETQRKAENHIGFIAKQQTLQARLSEDQMSENAAKKGEKAGKNFGKLGVGGVGRVSGIMRLKSTIDQKKANDKLPPNSPSGFIDINPLRSLIGRSASDPMPGAPRPHNNVTGLGNFHTELMYNVDKAHFAGGEAGGEPLDFKYAKVAGNYVSLNTFSGLMDDYRESFPTAQGTVKINPSYSNAKADTLGYVNSDGIQTLHPYLAKGAGSLEGFLANSEFIMRAVAGEAKLNYRKYSTGDLTTVKAEGKTQKNNTNDDGIFTHRGFNQNAIPMLNPFIGNTIYGGRIGQTINADVPGQGGFSRREGSGGFDIFSGASMIINSAIGRNEDSNVKSGPKERGHFADSSLRDNAWDRFYNADHTNKSEGYHYGANVNRENLDMRYQGKEDRFQSSVISRTGDITGGKLKDIVGKNFNTKEPYIITDIPDESGQAKSSAEKIKDEIMRIVSQFSPIKKGVEDVERLGKYLSSPHGLAFIAKQEALGLAATTIFPEHQDDGSVKLVKGRQRFGAFYDPFSGTLASAGSRLIGEGQNILYTRGFAGEPFYAGGFPSTQQGVPSISSDKIIEDSFTGGTPFQILTNTEALEIRVKENFEKTNLPAGERGIVKERSGGGDRHTLAGLQQGANLSEAFKDIKQFVNAEDYEKEKHGLPFYFMDLRTDPPTYLIFRAYMTGFTEEISPTWNSATYIGRSEPVYNYANTERSLNFTLKLAAHTQDELTAIYVKMNHLTSMCYPEYIVDEQKSVSGMAKLKSKPPLLKLRIGEYIGSRDNEVIGFLKSLSYAVPDGGVWETRSGKRVPKYVDVTVGYQVIHANVPNLNFSKKSTVSGQETFYGINRTQTLKDTAEVVSTADATPGQFGNPTSNTGDFQ